LTIFSSTYPVKGLYSVRVFFGSRLSSSALIWASLMSQSFSRRRADSASSVPLSATSENGLFDQSCRALRARRYSSWVETSSGL
jgi:hypothetical protein